MTEMEHIVLDSIDRRILAVLREDGRITNQDLSQRVGLSPTPCWMRLQKLEKSGIVSGYHAHLNLRKIAPVATVLMDMARTETRPRTERLALALETAIKAGDLRMHRHPRQEAGFSVLKSPDIPSVLLEVGFLSSARDLKRLSDPKWRARMAEAVRQGILAWTAEDLAMRALRD